MIRAHLICLLSVTLTAAQPVRPAQKLSQPAPAVHGPFAGPILPGTSAWTLTSDGALWLGTGHGLWRHTRSGWDYYAGKRYLPNDQVTGLGPADASGVYVVTPGGTVRLGFAAMTLEEKASLFEQRVEERHNRHGMVADSMLLRPGDLASNRTVSSDNDGLWTAMYGASQCFRYAVTKADAARQHCERSVEALLYLEKITGIPGFPARSYVRAGEIQPGDGVWYDNPAEHLRWKADTSSDEIVGHFFLFSVAYDTLPDSELKQRMAKTAARIMDHILQNGYNLIDRTGKPTTWGKWSPGYFASKGGRADSPLNALELLSFLRAARHITGDTRYDREYDKAAREMGYAKISSRYLELAEELNYSDEELAMLSFYTLFRYERDPQLLPIYQTALAGWWRNIQREHNPLWNVIFIHSAAPKRGDERYTNEGLTTLERIPLNLVNWNVENRYRQDVQWDAARDRFEAGQSTNWLAPDERPVMKWNGNPFRVNGGDGGKTEDDGAFYLLPYWLGRYWHVW